MLSLSSLNPLSTFMKYTRAVFNFTFSQQSQIFTCVKQVNLKLNMYEFTKINFSWLRTT